MKTVAALLLTAYMLQIFDFLESRLSSDRMTEVCQNFARRWRRLTLTHSAHPDCTQIRPGQ